MVSGDGGSAPSGDSGGGIGPPNLDAEAQANIAHATRVSPITVSIPSMFFFYLVLQRLSQLV